MQEKQFWTHIEWYINHFTTASKNVDDCSEKLFFKEISLKESALYLVLA